jgi:thiol-disulfide isomerase/thioredoxin
MAAALRAMAAQGGPAARALAARPAAASLPTTPWRTRPAARRRLRLSLLAPRAIHIDRRAALERSWQRQQRAADLELSAPPRGAVLEIASLPHLERVLERASAQGEVVVALFYSRSCGACRRARETLEALAREARSSRTRSTFCCIDVRDEYDHVSAPARLYAVRAVPSFAFFVDGALVRRLSLRDVRALGGHSPAQIRQALDEDVAGLRRTYRAVVLSAAPSAGGGGGGGMEEDGEDERRQQQREGEAGKGGGGGDGPPS